MNPGKTDIEDRSRPAATLRESERQWREVFEHYPAMYFMVDATGTVLSVNTFGASQLGYAVDELVGQSVLNLVFDENDKELVWKNIAVCVETLGQSHRWDAQKIRKDGTVLWTPENASALRWSDNQVIVLIACEDITERYRDELELARLAAIISSSDDAIVSKTLDGKVTSWNAGATTIFGYEAREMIGQPITHIIPPELHEDETQILTRLQRGERIRHYETVRVAKDGRRVDVSLTVSPLFDKSGKVVGASKVTRDITAAKRGEADLQQTRTELARVSRVTTLGELTAAIAHEVNQPLTGLVSSANACLRWLAAETPNLDAARRSIERMIKDANRSGEIINRIRTMVKKAPAQRESVNINDTIMEVMALALTEVRRNSVSVHAELSDDLPPVLGDRIQLQQVILNLVMNAIEAMSGIDQMQRKLSISSARDESNRVLVAVSDSGTGLEPTSLNRLFDAFYTTKVDGMGMGLAISRILFKPTAGGCGPRATYPGGLHSNSPCRLTARRHRDCSRCNRPPLQRVLGRLGRVAGAVRAAFPLPTPAGSGPVS